MKKTVCDSCGQIIPPGEEWTLKAFKRNYTHRGGKAESKTIIEDLCENCVNTINDMFNAEPAPPRNKGRSREIDREKVLALHAEGKNFVQIAKELHIGTTSVSRIVNEEKAASQ